MYIYLYSSFHAQLSNVAPSERAIMDQQEAHGSQLSLAAEAVFVFFFLGGSLLIL